MATCPECEAEIELDESDVDAGDSLSCDECGTTLVVIKTSPMELDVADEHTEDDDTEGLGQNRGSGDDDESDEET